MKRILFSLLIAMVLLFTVGGVALADDPTTVVVNWAGAGGVGAGVDSGDSNGGFATSGDAINGSFTATDSNNNPYSYGVDNFSVLLNGSVTNGYLNTGDNRVNSYVPMYGAGGQVSWSNVSVSGGSASMAYRSTTNFAAMGDGTYTYQLPGGHNIVVNAVSYLIDRLIQDGRGNQGYVLATGNGIATLDCMSAGASGYGSLELGRGQGCYTDANFSATGISGRFEATGVGNNGVTFNGMGVSSGGGSLSVIANWANSFSINDFSLTAN